MTARIAGIVTRSQAGLRAPKGRPSTNITPQNGGACTHWGGTRQWLGPHSRCITIWRSWQNYHMAPGGLGTANGANDIAYNFGYCNHGYVFVGRGWHVRSGANGSSAGNQNYYAFTWIGGSGDGNPTRAALDALDWLIVEGRLKGMGRRVRPHRFFTGSTCSGSFLISHSATLDNKFIALPAVTEKEDAMTWQQMVRQWAMNLGLTNGSNPTGNMTREQMWATIKNYDDSIDGDFLRQQKSHLAQLSPRTDGSALRHLVTDLRNRR